MDAEEQQLLKEHRKMFDQFLGFLCSGCDMPKKKKNLGTIAVFKPAKTYSLFRKTTYILCDDCIKLTDAEIYAKVEAWLMKRGHLAS